MANDEFLLATKSRCFDYEAPDLLRLALCENDRPDGGNELPGILFRRTAADAVEILMIKQLPIEHVRENGAREAWRIAQTDVAGARGYLRTNPDGDVSFELRPLPITELSDDDLYTSLERLVDQFDRRVKTGAGEVRVNAHSRNTFKALRQHSNVQDVADARPDYEELSIPTAPIGTHALLRSGDVVGVGPVLDQSFMGRMTG